jgi:hypothetical protein
LVQGEGRYSRRQNQLKCEGRVGAEQSVAAISPSRRQVVGAVFEEMPTEKDPLAIQPAIDSARLVA